MAVPPMSKRDADQVLRTAFDDATGRLKVDANVMIAPGGISAADGDNIAISDGVDTMSVNADGSINTAISGQVQIEIDAADGDNIAISDGTNTMTVNPDGSIDVNGSFSLSTAGTLIDRSGTATNVSTQMMAANPDRKYLLIQNATGNTLWFNFTTAATNAPPSIELRANSNFIMEGTMVSTEAINVIRAGAANVAYTAKEGS